ncbi:MAG TPA: IS91 family transposase [Terriglobales bacterium]
MSRPPLEVADLIHAAGIAFLRHSQKWFTWLHLKILTAIVNCRTSALGGHIDECSNCGHRAISFNSCRNRHCPKCQANARDRWLQARRRELLPTRYVHVVFTLPGELAPLALQNKREVYSLLFRASAETLLAVASDPQHLGAEIGFFSVLHTWNQKLLHHPHVHCVVPAGGLAPDHARWISAPTGFFLPVKVLSRVFRGKFVTGLRELHTTGALSFHGSLAHLQSPPAFAAMLRSLFRSDWVVYAKRPFGGAEHALRYLGCYTHRVAISNHRLVALHDGQVAFRWRDSAHHNKKRLMQLPLEEFLRRFFLHVLPKGFVRIRHFGFLAHRRRATLLPLCFELLTRPTNPDAPTSDSPPDSARPLWLCPRCGGAMAILERFDAAEARLRSPPLGNLERL